MRVIAGLAKGRRLKSPVGLATRPTTDRIKESIFSILHPYLLESYVLDLFSGTGNLGIEALSRGAEKAIFVDNNKNSIRVICENIEITGFKEKSKVFHQEALKTIRELAHLEQKYDIVFMDPPYLKGFIIPCVQAIEEEGLLSSTGIIVIEHDSKDVLPEKFAKLTRIKNRKYGNTTISIYSEEA
ncbi:16S rRNA (guanine(966)-N(2))-methyltransferase RsmD [Geosporobacter ferrireducens]|uniref:16S rRNA (Guanine(966)-N(2))-methyltransferase RsmD n=1 Tax=Geosporobacter ferrireducens TaxID=1424294 RepID=A0A1D8GBW9_9FIRM|nr:16S rRNA (guanine(966)-N(2))-methyltransferase RsmD [Geosporobacter ferrireducens]AOT68405.1 16S rRNA (guanine(966)-N(2))-methyltransferase RsmD [Geosporobacter ferrireducens]